MALSNTIYEQLKEYAVCNEDFDEIQDMNILEESYDSIAPSTQNIEPQDLADGIRTYILTLKRTIIYLTI